MLLGKERFAGVDIRVRVKGGGRVAQVYGQRKILFLKHEFNPSCFMCDHSFIFTAIRQAISKALVAYYQKCKYIYVPHTGLCLIDWGN